VGTVEVVDDEDVDIVMATLFDIRATVYEIRDALLEDEDEDGPGEEEETQTQARGVASYRSA